MTHKVLNLEQLKENVEFRRRLGVNIVTTNGAFDILHAGHIMALRAAKEYGYLIVGLNSDASIRKYKGSDRPINNEEDRAIVLGALSCVDAIYIFDESTPNSFLEVVKPTYHVKSKSGYKGLEKEVVERYGGKIILIDDKVGYSSTSIIEKCRSQREGLTCYDDES